VDSGTISDTAPLNVFTSSGLEESDNETIVYIDVTGIFIPQQPSETRAAQREDDKTDQIETTEGQGALEEETEQAETEDLEKKNLETLEEIAESEEQVRENDETEIEVNGEAKLMHETTELDVEPELTSIQVAESEDDEPDSTSVFSTCDEWLESPTSVRARQDQTTSLNALNVNISDSIAGLAEPDGSDLPPLAPRDQVPVQPTGPAAYSHGDVARLSCPAGKSPNVCLHCTRGVDRPASSHSSRIGLTQAQRPPKHRPKSAVSPSVGGRVPCQASRAAPTSNGASRLTAAPAASSRSLTRPSDNHSTRRNAPLQSSERARTIKPISLKGRKPAWK